MSRSKFWDDLNTQLMVTAAHRYCISRHSYISGVAIEWLRKYRRNFEPNTIRVIVRDTIEALQDGLAGSPITNAPAWKKLATDMFNEMPNEDKDWVKASVAYRNREWPL